MTSLCAQGWVTQENLKLAWRYMQAGRHGIASLDTEIQANAERLMLTALDMFDENIEEDG